MAKEYKAFISYRHIPADSAVAEKLHKCIERYRIPSGMDAQGKRRLGRVFRDKEELPLSVSLDDSIHEALDHAEFLIVICSKETPKSAWVREEIKYFCQNHDRDHIMAVLVDGEPYEAFPQELLHVYAEDGITILKDVEPIAADVRANTKTEQAKLMSREFVRVYARMLNCDYDDLYRREQRYRAQRAVALSAVVAAVSALFIGMLLNRNAVIKRQMLNAKINESKALASLSWQAYREGDYRGALNDALDALPGRDPERPYVSEAEAVLADELYLYQSGALRYVQSFDQATSISRAKISAKSDVAVTADVHGLIRAYEVSSGKLLWDYPEEDSILFMETLNAHGTLLLSTADTSKSLSLIDGTAVWELPGYEIIAFANDGRTGLGYQGELDIDGWHQVFCLVDLENGEIQRKVGFDGYGYPNTAALTESGSTAAVLMEEEYGCGIVILDFQSEKGKRLHNDYPSGLPYVYYTMCFSPKNDLVFAYASAGNELGGESQAGVMAFDSESEWQLKYETPIEINTEPLYVNYGYSYLPSLEFFACNDQYIAVGGKRELALLDLNDGSLLWEIQLPGIIAAARLYDKQGIGLILSNGVITFCTWQGVLSYEHGIYSFEADYNVYSAAVAGEKYLDSVFMLIPAGNHRRASVVGFYDNPTLSTIIDADSIPDYYATYLSPKGKWVVCLGENYDSDGLYGVMCDTTGGQAPYSFFIQDFPWYRQERCNVFVAEDGTIIAGGVIINPWDETYRGINRNGDLPDFYNLNDKSCISQRDGSVYTASIDFDGSGSLLLLLWRDGILTNSVPFPEQKNEWMSYEYACVGYGENGYVIVSVNPYSTESSAYRIYAIADNQWIEPDNFCSNMGVSRAMAAKQPWLAVVEADSTLHLYDIKNNKTVISVECAIPATSASKLMFTCEDRVLALLSMDGDMALYDTLSGQLLSSTSYADRNLCFSQDGRYSFYTEEDQNRMLIVYSDIKYTESACMVINMDTWESEGVYQGVEGYDPSRKRLIVAPEREGIAVSSLYTLEDMMLQAENILDTGLMTIPGLGE